MFELCDEGVSAEVKSKVRIGYVDNQSKLSLYQEIHYFQNCFSFMLQNLPQILLQAFPQQPRESRSLEG